MVQKKFTKLQFANNRFGYLLYAIFAAYIILTFLGANRTDVPFSDEILYEEISYTMAFSGDLVVPYLDGEPWPQRPPLYFWLTIPILRLQDSISSIHPLADSLFRDGVFIYPWIRRFVTMVASITTAFLVYKIACILLNRKYALISVIILFASPLWLFLSKVSSLDILASMFMTLSMYLYITKKESSKSKYIYIGLAIGCGVLTRSVLALTPLPVIIFDLILGNGISKSVKRVVVLLLTVLLISLPWHIAAYLKFPAEFISQYLSFNLVHHGLYLTPGYKASSPLFYIKTLFLYTPWLLLSLIYYIKIRTASRRIVNFKHFRLMITWVLIPLVALSILSTRHEWYFIQIFPPLAIIGSYFVFIIYKELSPVGKLVYIGLCGGIVFASIGGIIFMPRGYESYPNIALWIQDTFPDRQIYVYKHKYLPRRPLFHPIQVDVVNSLSDVENKPEALLFVSYHDNEEVAVFKDHLEVVRSFPLGTLYKLNQ